MKQIVLLTIFVLLLFSCGKVHTIRLSAKDAATGVPYAGLYYVVMKEKLDITGNSFKAKSSGVLNENGEVYVTMRFNKNKKYHIKVTEPNNACYNKNINYSYTLGDAKTDFPFEFAECGFLQLKVTNTNCQNSNDYIKYNMKPTYYEGYNGISEVAKYGCYDNEFMDSKVSSGTWRATWEVTRNNATVMHDTLFNIAPNEHYYLFLEY